jgi:hypothetical protein
MSAFIMFLFFILLQRREALNAVYEAFWNNGMLFFPLPKDLMIAQEARKASLLFIEESFGTPLRPFLAIDHSTLQVYFLFTVLYMLKCDSLSYSVVAFLIYSNSYLIVW